MFLLLLIIAMIATTAFYREAKSANLHPGKVASVPLISAGLFFIAGRGAALAFEATGAWSGIAPITVHLIAFMADGFLVLAYLLVIRRNWIALSNASNAQPN